MLPRVNPNVIYKALAEGAVLLSTTDEVYFGLNEVGARVWECLPPTLHTLDELCATIAAEYPDADPEVIRTDVSELLAELAAYGLICSADSQLVEDDGVTDAGAQANQTEPRRVA